MVSRAAPNTVRVVHAIALTACLPSGAHPADQRYGVTAAPGSSAVLGVRAAAPLTQAAVVPGTRAGLAEQEAHHGVPGTPRAGERGCGHPAGLASHPGYRPTVSSQPPSPRFLTLDQVADELNTSRSQVYASSGTA
jgi:hypothetical protein